MGNSQQLTNLTPYESSAVVNGPELVPFDDPDVIQLKVDVVNVIEGRVLIESFTPEYQKKIKDYYRFYGQRSSSKYPFYPKMTRSTLEAC